MSSNSSSDFKTIKILSMKPNIKRVILVENINSHKYFVQQQITMAKEEADYYISKCPKLKNPAILPIESVERKNSGFKTYVIIISEYLEKGSLSNALKGNNITPCQRYIILIGIAEGLKYLHSLDIIHGHLTPENILLDKDLYPYICDFSQHKLLLHNMNLDNYNQVLPYAAPEILKCKTSNEEKNMVYTNYIDIYSFSMIAYQLITGKNPYPTDKADLKSEIIDGTRPDLSCITEEEIKSFFEELWLPGSEKNKLQFENIIKTIQGNTFKTKMEVNNEKLNNYLKRFLLNPPSNLPSISASNKPQSTQNKPRVLPNSYETPEEKKQREKLCKSSKRKRPNISKYSSRPQLSSIDTSNSTDRFDNQSDQIRQSKSYEEEDYSADELLQKANNYYQGLEGSPNKKLASIYYKKSADKGNITAMNNYATMCLEGDGIKKNLDESEKYFKKAIENGSGIAMNNYANMLYEKDDKIKSIHFYKQATEKGVIEAMKSLGFIYYSNDGVKLDKAEAAYYYQLAADRGDDVSMNSFAHMLRFGDGIDIDKPKAAKYYELAAKKGNCNAMKSFAQMLLKGEGVPVDKKKAFDYFKKAADNGCISAMKNCANMLRYGDGVEINKKMAANYYYMAATKNDDVAANNYAFMLLNGEGVSVNKEKAAEYFKKAADNQNISAMKNYAHLLIKGKGKKINQEAIKYYKMAADKGDKNAIKIVIKILREYKEVDTENRLKELVKYENMLYNIQN